jgi:hypothetical protein
LTPGSIIYAVAQVAVETGIDPQSLLDCDPDLFTAIVMVLKERADG